MAGDRESMRILGKKERNELQGAGRGGYLRELRRNRKGMLWLTAAFGTAFSLKGASVESLVRANVEHTIPGAEDAGVVVPMLTGRFDLAADQNLWYSYRYALCGIMIGLAVSAAIVLVRYLTTCKEV